MTDVVDQSLVDRARSALDRHDWREAFDLLSKADRSGQLSPDALELLGQASWWVGRLPDAIGARERAYAGFVKAGEPLLAARIATLVGRDNLLRNSPSVARAWFNRAERLIAGLPESPANGWLEACRSLQDGLEGNVDEAFRRASNAYDIAVRFGDLDLEALAMSGKGMSLIARGEVEQGLALVDEAAVSAVAGEIEPLSAGAVCCTTIGACTSLGDWPRAAQWIDAQDRWCQREHINGFPGMCRLYRVETKRFQGAWTEAESEARRASEELQGFIPAAIGIALYEIGTIRLRRGDLPTAEEALLQAHARGRDPEPALSLLRLAQGRGAEAAASIRRAIEEPPTHSAWNMAPSTDLNMLALLPAQAEIALATDDVGTARRAADQLAALVDRLPSAAGRAAAASTEGAVRIAEGEAASAEPILREALAAWTSLDAPWETGRTRVDLARAYVASGSQGRALLELSAAKEAFERLGAAPDVRQVDELIGGIRGAEGASPPVGTRSSTRSGGSAVSRTFVFTDIVDSTRFAELLGDEAWDRLIAWHDATIRSLVTEHRGEIVKATGDGFFLAFPEPDIAISCAVAIQRRFADQREQHGFAPNLRIGVHQAEARKSGGDYIGAGVSQAARIEAIGGTGEIVASASTLAAVRGGVRTTNPRTAKLKGIGAPVDVVTIEWR